MKLTSLHWALALVLFAVAVAGGIIAAEFLINKSQEAAEKIEA